MSLLALQRDLQSWLTTEAPEVADRLGPTATAGLAVYTNNYRSQLMACIRDSYGSVHAWLGNDAFDAAAATHIDHHPPHSWTLDQYGRDFPETLDGLFPGDPEVGELARLENDLGLAFVGSDQAPLEGANIGAIDWDRAVFSFVPTFSIRRLTTNAAAIWSAINNDAQPPIAASLATPADRAVWREGFSPAFRTLEP